MRLISFTIVAVVAVAAAACSDPFAPIEWTGEPETVLLYSLHTPEHIGQPSAFDFINRQRRWVEQVGAAGSWDIALGEQANGFVLLTSGAFEGASPGAGIALAEAGASFEDVDRAPSGIESYEREQPVALVPGQVYVVRSRAISTFMGTCRYHSKIELVEASATGGWARLQYVTNPNCNDRALVPRGR